MRSSEAGTINIAIGADRTFQWHNVDDAIGRRAVLVDARSSVELTTVAIPEARNIPVDELRRT